ncbi:MAG: hypothetical protein C4554_10285 [Dethiobacter sp.]|nr:MAG: hypothetical protein C4554_10285 [Dethiobacter sp.]
MLKDTHYFLILLMIIILLMTVFTFVLTFSFFPHEEPAPRRSRPVSVQEVRVYPGEELSLTYKFPV